MYLDKVVRILPRFSYELNESWISDKIRFSYDFLFNQRLQAPWFKADREKSTFISVSWFASLKLFFFKILNAKFFYVFSGEFVDLFTLSAAKDFFSSIGNSNFSFFTAEFLSFYDFRFTYLMNSTLDSLENSTSIFLLNLDLRLEIPLINYRIRRSFMKNMSLKVFSSGYISRYFGFETTYLGNSFTSLVNFFEGKSKTSSFFFNPTKTPLSILKPEIYSTLNYFFLINHVAFENLTSGFIFKFSSFIAKKLNLLRDGWLGLNFVNTSTARLNAIEIGFLPGLTYQPPIYNQAHGLKFTDKTVLFLMNSDDKLYNFTNENNTSNLFLVYQGHHADETATFSNLILPGVTFLEKDGLYLNLLGFVQQTNKITNLYKHSKLDWEIFKALYFYKFLQYKFNFSIFFSFYEVFNFFISLISYNKFYTSNYQEVFLNSYGFSSFLALNNFFFNVGFFLNLFLC